MNIHPTRIARFALLSLGLCACGDNGSSQSEMPAQSLAPLVPDAIPGTAWEARHGLTAEAYQTEFNQFVARGYRPTYVSGYTDGSQPRYAAIFQPNASGGGWSSRHGITASEYQTEVNQAVQKGWRPVVVNGFSVGNQDRYVAIFEPANGMVWEARHGLSAQQYQNEFTRLLGLGYRLVHVSGYTAGGQERYAAIWDKSGGAAWEARHGLTPSQYQAEFDRLLQQGYRLRHVTGYSVGGQDRYAAIWDKSQGPAWIGRHNIDAATYQQAVTDNWRNGYRPVEVNAFEGASGTRFASIFQLSRTLDQSIDSIIDTAMRRYAIPGMAIAVTAGDRLVYEKGYGFANSATAEKVTTRHRFRIASLSKPITSAAILRLVDAGRLNLDTTVFGPNGILGDAYGTRRPYNPGITSITVRQLLMHIAGGWPNTQGTDPMFLFPNYGHTELISWVLDNRPLDNTPGTNFAYSNFGYSIVGRVIEKVTGKTYDQYVRESVLAPCGITDMELGGDTQAERKTRETAYYDRDPAAPYTMKVHRMDSHGGWIASARDLVRFAACVNGFPGVPDILRPQTITLMASSSSLNNYGLGWYINTSLNNWWHSGSLPGTRTILVRTSQGLTWSALTNSSNDANLDQLMWDVVSSVSSWPNVDLF